MYRTSCNRELTENAEVEDMGRLNGGGGGENVGTEVYRKNSTDISGFSRMWQAR